MKRISEILIVTILILVTSCSTTNKCSLLLSEKVDLSTIQKDKDEFIKKIKSLIDCEFEPIDKEILFGNDKDGMVIDYLFQLFEEINKSSSKDKNITFKEIKQIIEELINNDEYKIGRQIVIAKNQIIDKQAKISTWKEDSNLLSQMNLTELDFVQIKKIIEKNEDKNWTYNNIFQELAKIYHTSNTMECPIPSYYDMFILPHNLNGYYELSEGIECSKISNKPILLYFSGHGSVNSRKFEEYVLSDQEILNILNQKFIIIDLIVDDRNFASKQYQIYSELSNDTIKQIGKINQYYQKTFFNDDVQPAFYIIDSAGNQLTKSYYFNTSIDSFKNYLINGIEKYYKL